MPSWRPTHPGPQAPLASMKQRTWVTELQRRIQKWSENGLDKSSWKIDSRYINMELYFTFIIIFAFRRNTWIFVSWYFRHTSLSAVSTRVSLVYFYLIFTAPRAVQMCCFLQLDVTDSKSSSHKYISVCPGGHYLQVSYTAAEIALQYGVEWMYYW